MPNQWYMTRNNKERLGPFSIADLHEMADAGQIQPSDMLLQQGAPKWVTADSVAGVRRRRIGLPPSRSSQASRGQSRRNPPRPTAAATGGLSGWMVTLVAIAGKDADPLVAKVGGWMAFLVAVVVLPKLMIFGKGKKPAQPPRGTPTSCSTASFERSRPTGPRRPTQQRSCAGPLGAAKDDVFGPEHNLEGLYRHLGAVSAGPFGVQPSQTGAG